MKIFYEDAEIEVQIIGGFKVNDKEYAVCSYVDSNEVYKIVIVQVIRDGKDIQVINIPDDEKEFVLSKYNEIKINLLEGEDYE